jgi:hypothetical protein
MHGGLRTDPVLKCSPEWKQSHTAKEPNNLPVIGVNDSHRGKKLWRPRTYRDLSRCTVSSRIQSSSKCDERVRVGCREASSCNSFVPVEESLRPFATHVASKAIGGRVAQVESYKAVEGIAEIRVDAERQNAAAEAHVLPKQDGNGLAVLLHILDGRGQKFRIGQHGTDGVEFPTLQGGAAERVAWTYVATLTAGKEFDVKQLAMSSREAGEYRLLILTAPIRVAYSGRRAM